MSRDYFINNQNINAYTINAFAEAVAEATKQGLALDYDSARRIGSSFSISIASQEEAQVEAEETPADQTESVEAQSADATSGETEQSEEGPDYPDGPEFDGYENRLGNTEGIVGDGRKPFTLEDIEQAKDSMEELKKLAEPVGISGRSKRDVAQQLREYIGA